MKTNPHTWECGHSARGNGFGGLLDLDEAHTAVSSDGEAAVIAEPRNVNSGDLASLEHCHPLGDFDGEIINEHLDGVIRVGEVDTGASNGSRLGEIRRGFRRS